MDRHSDQCLKVVGPCFGTVEAQWSTHDDREQWTDRRSPAFLRRWSVVVLQQATEPLMRHNAPMALRLGDHGQNQLVAQTLMVPLVMVMCHELVNSPSKRSFTDENPGGPDMIP